MIGFQYVFASVSVCWSWQRKLWEAKFVLASLSNFLEEVGIELSALLMAPNACRDYDKLTRTFGDYVGILDIYTLPVTNLAFREYKGIPIFLSNFS